MRIFLDANVLVSVLNKEYPVFTFAARILSLANNKKYTVYTSPICLAIAFYFAEKKSGTSLAKEKIKLLVDHLLITKIDGKEVTAALTNKKVNDFEDGLEYYAAKNNNCQVIITEDKNDFYFSEIEVLGSKDFLEKYLLKEAG
jgi:predicted nucleic acid-binding protein